MDVQQINPLESSASTHTKLIDDQENPPIGSSFDKKENSSDIRQRIFISEQEALNGSLMASNAKSPHQSQFQSQLEELSPKFEVFYKAVMLSSLAISTGALLWTLFTLNSTNKPLPLSVLDFMLEVSMIGQSIFAYQGFIKKDLREIEHAFFIMKATFLWMGMYLALKYVFSMKENKENKGSLDSGFLISGAVMVGLHIFLIFLPTRKVRNTWKLASQRDEKLKKRPLNPDSIEQLDSTAFTVFKYGHLIATFLGVRYSIIALFEDFSNWSETLAEMRSHWSFYFLSLLFISFNFLVFEGIRRKDLKKIEISIKLITIYLVGLYSSNILQVFALENGQIVWKYEKSFFEFFKDQGNLAFGCFYIFYFGIFRARSILRDHKESQELGDDPEDE